MVGIFSLCHFASFHEPTSNSFNCSRVDSATTKSKLANRFVVCTFVPRPFETDPGALKVPFFHNNDDFDEVIFYHAGEFFSRDNIHPGMITLHPAGFTHGPHPKALENMLVQKADGTNEVAVMIDTRDALDVGPAAGEVEWKGYVDSWRS